MKSISAHNLNNIQGNHSSSMLGIINSKFRRSTRRSTKTMTESESKDNDGEASPSKPLCASSKSGNCKMLSDVIEDPNPKKHPCAGSCGGFIHGYPCSFNGLEGKEMKCWSCSQEEIGEGQSKEDSGKNASDPGATETNPVAKETEPQKEELGRGKRRRPLVDYAHLDKVLRQGRKKKDEIHDKKEHDQTSTTQAASASTPAAVSLSTAPSSTTMSTTPASATPASTTKDHEKTSTSTTPASTTKDHGNTSTSTSSAASTTKVNSPLLKSSASMADMSSMVAIVHNINDWRCDPTTFNLMGILDDGQAIDVGVFPFFPVEGQVAEAANGNKYVLGTPYDNTTSTSASASQTKKPRVQIKRHAGTPSGSVAQMKDAVVRQNATSIVKKVVQYQAMTTYQDMTLYQNEGVPTSDVFLIHRDNIEPSEKKRRKGLVKRAQTHYSVLIPARFASPTMKASLGDHLIELGNQLKQKGRNKDFTTLVTNNEEQYLESIYGTKP
jgi:hypothetical protein